jgi:hypothetical protein
MVEWTLAKIRSEIRRLTGRRSTNSISDADLTERINHFYTLLLPYEIDLAELSVMAQFNTEAGTGEYVKSADNSGNVTLYFTQAVLSFGSETLAFTNLTTGDILRIDPGVAAYDSSGTKTDLDLYLEPGTFFNDYPDESNNEASERSRPSALLLYSNTIYLRPVPDAVYTVKFPAKIQKPPELTADTDVLWDHAWGWLVCHGAAIQVLHAAGEFEEAAALSTMYETLKSAMSRKQVLRFPATHRAAPRF